MAVYKAPIKDIQFVLNEVLDVLDLKPGMTVVDCTLGWAGHSAEFLRRVGPTGLLIGLGTRLPSAAAGALVALMALFHGHAHGSELPAMVSAWSYAAGFVLSTSLLHVIGLGIGMFVFRTNRPAVIKALGFGTTLTGIAMVSGA